MTIDIGPFRRHDGFDELDRRLHAVEQMLLAQRRHASRRRFGLPDRLMWAAAGAVFGAWAVAAVTLVPELLR